MADELGNAIDVIIKNLRDITTKDLENLSNKVEFELWERGLYDKEGEEFLENEFPVF